ncbi:hypothetical protein AYI69_g6212 [Smittium culicis]|uniref:Uncharacterized protein n=1 Tax=Smittium culicis TaxID=133412 RepID=A0A1R1Y0D7_9FUNG|nr:hypothetical protein AYI69_g6212 [Smittium culicis]
MSAVNTAGLIVFRAFYNKPVEYLLFSDNYSNNRHWSPPKGKLFESEDEEQSALRNTCEITGMPAKDIQLKKNFRAKIKYLSGSDIKIAVFYLGRIVDPASSLKSISDCAGISFSWLQLDKALEKVIYQNIKDILNKAEEFIIKNRDSMIKPSPPNRDSAFLKFPNNNAYSNPHAQITSNTHSDYQNRPSRPQSKFVKPNIISSPQYEKKDYSYNQGNSPAFDTVKSPPAPIDSQKPDYNWRAKNTPTMDTSSPIPEDKPDQSVFFKPLSQSPADKDNTWRFRDYEGDWADEDMDSDWEATIAINTSMIKNLSISEKSPIPGQQPPSTDNYQSNNYRNNQSYKNNQSYRDNQGYRNNQNYRNNQGYRNSYSDSQNNRDYQNNRNSQNNRDNQNYRDNHSSRDNFANRDNRRYGDNQNNRDSQNFRNNQNVRDRQPSSESRFNRDGRSYRDGQTSRDSQTSRDPQHYNDSQSNRDSMSLRDTQYHRDGLSNRESQNFQNRRYSPTRNSRSENRSNDYPSNDRFKPNNHSSSDQNGNQENSLYKTKLCEKYVSTGDCPYGSKCVFAHGNSDLRSRPMQNPQPNFSQGQHNLQNQSQLQSNSEFRQPIRTPSNYDTRESNPMYKTNLCDRFEKYGNCNLGDRCNFAHGPSELRKRATNRISDQYPQSSQYSHNNNSNSNSSSLDYNSSKPTSETRSGNFSQPQKSYNSSSTYFGPRSNPIDSGYINKPSPSLNSGSETIPKPLIPPLRSEKPLTSNTPKSDSLPQKVGVYIPPIRKNSSLSKPPSSIISSNNITSGLRKKIPIFPASNDSKFNSNKSMKNISLSNEYKPLSENSDPSSFSSNQNSLKQKAKQAEQSLIKTFASYFYGPNPFDTQSPTLIVRSINEELKEVNKIEFKLNLTKKQLILALIVGLFLPTGGKIPKSFALNRMKLLVRIISAQDQSSILSSLISLYNYGNEQLNKNLFSSNPSSIQDSNNSSESSNSSKNDIWSAPISNLLMAFYNEDIIDEDYFLDWHSRNKNDTATNPAIDSMEVFAQWLK